MENNNSDSLLKLIRKELIILVLMAIYFSGVLGALGNYIAILLLPMLIVKNGFFKYLDGTTFLLFGFSIFYTIFSTLNGFNNDAKANIIFFFFNPTLFYILGRYLMDRWKSNIYFLLSILIVFIALPVIIDTFEDISVYGFITFSRGLDVEGSNDIAATLLGVKISLCVASLGIIFSKTENTVEKKYKIILAVFSLLSIVVVVHLINRTGLVLAIIAIFLVVVRNFREYKLRNIIIAFAVITILFSNFILPIINSSIAIDAYAERENKEGYETTNAGGRTERWANGTLNILTHPIGNSFSFEREYVHNFWLDVAYVGGILPFLFLFMGTFAHLKRSYFLIWKSKNISIFLISLLIVMNVGFFLSSFVEPIMDGMPVYAFLYFCFWGMTSIIYRDSKILETEYIEI